MSSEWKWTKAKLLAAQYVSDDQLADIRIAKECDISKATLERWKATPEFVLKVVELTAAAHVEVLKSGPALKAERLRILADNLRRINLILKAREAEHFAQVNRADDPERPDVLPGVQWFEDHKVAPGGESGILVRDIKIAATGDKVTVFTADTGLLKERRETLRQIREELDRSTTYSIDPTKLSDEQLTAILENEDPIYALTVAGRGGAGEAQA